jgi:CheY-like chemotaxis protein
MSTTGKVLVIDDDPDFLEFVRIILEARGYSVVCARNADHGLSLMRTEHPDLILLDMLMSYTMEGLDVTRAMGEDPELRKIPLIVVSAVFTGANGLQRQVEKLPPIAAFLAKPVEPDELLNLVAENIPHAET